MVKVGRHGNSLRLASSAPLQEPKQVQTKKEVREEENEEAIGGMRNPNKAVAHLRGWRQLGNCLRRILDDAMVECPTIEELIDKLRRGEHPEEDICFLETLKAAAESTAFKLADYFGVPSATEVGPSGWRWKLLELIKTYGSPGGRRTLYL